MSFFVIKWHCCMPGLSCGPLPSDHGLLHILRSETVEAVILPVMKPVHLACLLPLNMKLVTTNGLSPRHLADELEVATSHGMQSDAGFQPQRWQREVRNWDGFKAKLALGVSGHADCHPGYP